MHGSQSYNAQTVRKVTVKFKKIFHILLLQELLVYPPKMYFPTRMIVTDGPLKSQYEWKVYADQPFTVAR